MSRIVSFILIVIMAVALNLLWKFGNLNSYFNGIKTEATISSIIVNHAPAHQIGNKKRGVFHATTFQFVVRYLDQNGNTHEVTIDGGGTVAPYSTASDSGHQINDKVNIKYDRNSPGIAIESDPWGLLALFLFLLLLEGWLVYIFFDPNVLGFSHPGRK